MFDTVGRARAAPASPPPFNPEFYTIELSRLQGGAIRVALTAVTIDDDEPQLLSQEIATERVPTLTKRSPC